MLRQPMNNGSDDNVVNQAFSPKNVHLQQWESMLFASSEPLESEDDLVRQSIRELDDFKVAVVDLECEFSLDHPTLQLLLSLIPVFSTYAGSSASLTGMSHHELRFSSLWGFLFIAVKHAVNPENSQRVAEAIEASGTSSEHVHRPSPFAEIVFMLKDLSQRFELVEVYCAKIPTYQGISQVAVDVHIALLQFCGAVITCFRGAFYGDRASERWIYIKECYGEVKTILDDSGKRLERLAWGSALPSTDDIKSGTSRLILQDVIVPKIKLPYEKLPSRRNPQFHGRKGVLSNVEQHFDEGIRTFKLTAVTIEGLGGVGKTQIALEFAHSQHGKRDAIIWIHSETAVAMSRDLSAAAVDLCLPGALPHEIATNRLLMHDWLQTTDATWTIILDNVEDPEMLEEFWPARGVGSILITARKPAISFQLATERVEILPFDDKEGPELLLNLLARPRDDVETRAARDLTEKLGGHPLAISQMAALMKVRNFSISSFNTTYDRNKKKIHRTHRSTRPSGYDLFLDTVWKLSFEILTMAGRALLGIIAIISPDSIPSRLFLPEKPWEPPRDLEFCEDEFSLSEVEEQLLTLALVKKNPYLGEISVHRLVQTEFWYYLPKNDRQEAFNNASKLLYQNFPKQVSGRLMLDRWSSCQLYEQHVLSLVSLYGSDGEDHGDLKPPVEFCKLMCNAAWYLSEKGLSDELNFLLQVAFRAYDACEDEKKDPIDYAHLCNTMGIVTHNKGDFVNSKYYLQQCHDLRSNSRDPDLEEMANIYNNLGNVSFSVLEYENALSWHRKAEVIRMARGDEWATSKGMTHLNMGRSLWRLGQRPQAWSRLDSAIAAFKFSGNWYLLSHAHLLLGTFHRESQDLDAAEKHYNIAKGIMKAEGHIPNQFTTSAILYKLGCVALQRNEVNRAIEHLRDSLAIAELRSVAKGDLARVMHKLAEALRKQVGLEIEAEKTMATANALRREVEKEKYNSDDQSEQAYDRIVCGNFR